MDGLSDVAHEGVKAPFQVAGATVPAGDYDNPQVNFGMNSPAGNPWRLGLYSVIGGYYNGKRQSASPFLSYRKDETLTASFSWNFHRIDLPSAEDAFNVNLVQARLEYSFTPKMNLQTLLQYKTRATFWRRTSASLGCARRTRGCIWCTTRWTIGATCRCVRGGSWC